MQEKKYTLQWLDLIITFTLDPSKTNVDALGQKEAETIIAKALSEIHINKTFLKQQTFTVSSKRKIQHLIKQHHSTLVILLDQACENALKLSTSNPVMISTIQTIIGCVDELLTFIENHFWEYISLDERVPAAYLTQIKKEVANRIDSIRPGLIQRVGNKNLTDILLGVLGNFNSEHHSRPVSLREVFYKKEVIKGLEKIHAIKDQDKVHDAVIELLVYLNFNSRSFMNYYTQKLAQKINAYGPIRDKMTQLLLCYKEFNQMHRKPGVKLNPNYADVKKVIGNWFAQEILYLEKKNQWDVSPLQDYNPSPPANSLSERFKILCFLSVDQIGLLFRAMDSLRILKARSLNQVYQSITPYLSTPRKQDISWESMRNKSYSVEQRDKEVLIKTLESIIEWVKEY
ncbi:hypothetical protein [Dyadobacter sp. 3J3]|uniref:hypothetical protein n=1 Tax=Dyadobacter sp. 3J3 TaxID=2606600 RepID=UPI00135A0DD4|nr:hypothetical protein [Dyadobacter sp. 3J3]